MADWLHLETCSLNHLVGHTRRVVMGRPLPSHQSLEERQHGSLQHVWCSVALGQRQVQAIQPGKQRRVGAVGLHERREPLCRSDTLLLLHRGQPLGIDVEHPISPRLALQGIARMHHTRVHQHDTPG